VLVTVWPAVSAAGSPPCQDAGVIVVVSGLASVAAIGLIALGAQAGGAVLAAAIALVVIVIALGWSQLGTMPDATGTGVTVAVTGVAAALVALLSADRARPLLPFAALVAFAVLAAFVHELRRRDGRPRLVESITGTLTGQLVVILAAGWLLLRQTPLGVNGVLVAAAAVTGARLVGALCASAESIRPLVAGWLAFGVGLGAAVGASFVLVPGLPLRCMMTGAVVAAVVAGADLLIRHEGRAVTTIALLTAALAPVAAAGTSAYAAALLAS
jgi:hypothetical protein